MAVTRDQVEAHLFLNGWMPSSWGQGGASKNDVVVYTTKTKVWEQGADGPTPRFNVHTAFNQDPDTIAKHQLDAWLWSDPLFWKIANQCLEYEACQHEGHDGPDAAAWRAATGMYRCHRCHQPI